MIKKLLALLSAPFERSNTKLFVPAFAIIFCFSIGVHAQTSNYQVDQVAGTIAPLPAGRTNLILTPFPSTDNMVWVTALPFPFVFNGASYNSVNISLNGFVTFGNSPATTEYFPISGTGNYSGAIAVYGADLDLLPPTATNNVSYYYDTTPPVGSRIFKIQWIVKRSNGASTSIDGSTNNLTFQLHLYEGSNKIEMFYNSGALANTAFQGQIGLRGNDNSDYLNLNYPAQAVWPSFPSVMPFGSTNTASVITYGSYIQSSAPVSNRLFKWTPNPAACFRPNNLSVSGINTTSATVSWTAVSPAPTGYEYYITTDPLDVPTGATAGTAVSGVSQLFSSLPSGTTHYVYIRTNCGGSKSAWAATTFATTCGAVNIDYFQNFETSLVPAIPGCTVNQAVAGNPWVTEAADVPNGFPSKHAVYNASTTVDANSWFYTQGVNLTAGTSYRISYKYGGSTEFTFLTNKLKIRYGTATTEAAMTAGALIANHPSIKASPVTNVVNFVPTTSGVYYFGFNAYSKRNNGKIFLDDISVTLTTCFPPTSLTAGQLTNTSALVYWAAPATSPGSGYEYYYNTTGTAPDGSTLPTGTYAGTLLNLGNLAPATTYHFWVRSNCGDGDHSDWSSELVFTTVTPTTYTYCTPAGSGLQDPNGITNVTLGTINNTTGLEPGNYGDYSNLTTTVALGGSVPISITYQTGFGYNTNVYVDWNNDSDFNDAGELILTGESASGSPSTISGSFTVPSTGVALGAHRLRIGGADFGGVTPCRVGTYQAYEDYTIFITAAPAPLALSGTSTTVCSGTNTAAVTVTTGTGPGGYNVFSWNPANSVTGNATSGFIFNTNTTTNYVLTAFNTTTLVSNTSIYTVNINQPPTEIVLSPTATTSVCQGQTPQMITATGGIVTGETVLIEGFNGVGTPPGWVMNNSGSSGGTVAAGAFNLRPDGYNPASSSFPGGTWSEVFHSNDNSQFYHSDSDGQGEGSVTSVTLTSPTMDLAIYTTASLSFWHYYRHFSGDKAQVLISKDGGAYVNVASYESTKGSRNNFEKVVFDLSSYIGHTISVRFQYDATWGYGWALDNFLVSGSTTSAVVWTPAAGLFTDAAAQNAYVAGTGASTVYALPGTSTTYTATAASGLGCSTTKSVTVNVTPISGGNMVTANQIICANTPAAAVNITGADGTILYWQYAEDSNFTIGLTNIPGSAGLSTLTPALIGNVSATRYYRAVVSKGTCALAYSKPIHSITIPTTTWDGSVWSAGVPGVGSEAVFDGNYTIAANMNVCSVKVLSGIVKVNPDVTLTVENGIDASAGSFEFDNNSSLLQTTTSKTVNTGNVKYLRKSTGMIAYDYTYWSSPVAGQTLFNLSPDTRSDKYFTFDAIAGNWATVATPGSTLMQPGIGYMIRAPYTYTASAQQFSGNFTGVPNNGLVTVPIYVNGANNINFIGNPYPSAIDAEKLMQQNPVSLGGGTTFYYWTHNHGIANHEYTDTDYSAFNYTGSIGTGTPAIAGSGNSTAPTKYIAAGQGFMAVGAATGNVVFNNSIRVGGLNNRNFYKGPQEVSEIQKNRIWLDLTTENAYKQILIGYIENATAAFENGFDADVIESGNSVSFYSIAADNKFLSIQGKGLDFDLNEQLPLGYRASAAGSYTITLSDKDGFFTSQAVYLEDKLLNVIHNLGAEGAYTFVTEAGTFNDRFVIRYTDTNVLIAQQPVFNDNSVIVYKDRNGINFKTAGFTMQKIKIYDVNGRELLVRNNIASETAVISNLSVAQQMLLIRITSVDGITVTKKIVF